jgi:hypothetical protein
MDIKQMTGNKDKTYKFPETEAGYVHVQLVLEQYNPKTGKPITEPFPQKYDVRGWDNFLKHRNGFIIKKVFHLPEGAKTVAQADAELKKKKAAEAARIKKEMGR